MAKIERYFSIDVEASGPIPGPWWMPSFACCPTDDIQDGFKALLQPLVYCFDEVRDIEQADVPGAMKVVAMGTPNFEWDDGKTDEYNVKALWDYYKKHGENPVSAFSRFDTWILERSKNLGQKAYLVGAPLSFDFMWVYWYYQFLMDRMPSFGFAGLDLRSYYMGMHGAQGTKSNKRAFKRLYPTDIPHTHDPLDDAREQGEIWHKMVTDRKARADGPPLYKA